MKTFEQPLSAKEETEYLEIMNGEDLEAAHRARQILIERNLRLVAHVSISHTEWWSCPRAR